MVGSFDYLIVGSGAAGAAAARVLADSGATLAILEEGPEVATGELGGSAWHALSRLYRGMGAQATAGRSPMPLLQGRCLGGSTVVNSAIVRRMPERVWDDWRDGHGLAKAIPFESLEEKWELLERELSAGETPGSVQGANSLLLESAARSLGISGSPTVRFVRGRRASADCQVGCVHGAKQSMLISYLPYARERGAAVFTESRVDRVALRGDRVVGVEGELASPGGPRRFSMEARKGVIVAASALQTPHLLRRSGARSRHLGRHFQAHPGVLLLGAFERQVDMWSGATQGYEVDHWSDGERFKIESLALPPELIAARIPGVGARWRAAVGDADRLASWAVLLRARAEGRLTSSRLTAGAAIRYDLSREDVRNLRSGVQRAAELLFAAGAREVLPLVHGLPERLGPDQVSLLGRGPDDPACYALNTSHLFGTARMSLVPSQGVVAPDFSVHGTSNLFVVDSSVFPTNLGVNPQHSIMAVAMHAATGIVQAHA
jgi:choline dehydrogenase-like flavoprotein